MPVPVPLAVVVGASLSTKLSVRVTDDRRDLEVVLVAAVVPVLAVVAVVAVVPVASVDRLPRVLRVAAVAVVPVAVVSVPVAALGFVEAVTVELRRAFFP